LSEAPVSFQTATHVKCIWHTGSAQWVFKDNKGAEFQVGVMTKVQRTGMAPGEPYVRFPEAIIDTHAKRVGKKFVLIKDAAGGSDRDQIRKIDPNTSRNRSNRFQMNRLEDSWAM
jgi:hypothetical protein